MARSERSETSEANACCVDDYDCVQQIQTASLHRQTEDRLQVIHQRDCIAVIKETTTARVALVVAFSVLDYCKSLLLLCGPS